jgi:hypothetical protein
MHMASIASAPSSGTQQSSLSDYVRLFRFLRTPSYKERNLYYIQEQSKCNSRGKLTGDNREGQGCQGDSIDCQSSDNQDVGHGRKYKPIAGSQSPEMLT